jgi:subtilase family serine protease
LKGNVENHIAGIIAKDQTTIDILNGKYEDMHTLHALYFFKKDIQKHYNISYDIVTPELVSEMYHKEDFGKLFRTPSKPVTFSQL